MITKKFKDCRVRELRPKTTKPAKTRAKSGAGNAPRPVFLAWALTMIFVGSMAALGADFVPWNSIGDWMRRLGPLLMVIGVLSALRYIRPNRVQSAS